MKPVLGSQGMTSEANRLFVLIFPWRLAFDQKLPQDNKLSFNMRAVMKTVLRLEQQHDIC